MLKFIKMYLSWAYSRFNIVANLTAENLALRQQLNVLKRNQGGNRGQSPIYNAYNYNSTNQIGHHNRTELQSLGLRL